MKKGIFYTVRVDFQRFVKQKMRPFSKVFPENKHIQEYLKKARPYSDGFPQKKHIRVCSKKSETMSK